MRRYGRKDIRRVRDTDGRPRQERTFRWYLHIEQSSCPADAKHARIHIPISISCETGTVPKMIVLISVCKVTSSLAVLTDTTNAYRVSC